MIEEQTDEVLVDSAISLFLRENRSSSSEPDQYASTVEQLEGRLYVILRNYNGILAVYEVVGSGVLKKASKVPKALKD
ncbi:MAG: hypothetical protein WCR44_08645 [Verrucomicrobiota bacterium]